MQQYSLSELPEAFYRVSVKALITDKQGRLLVTQNKEGYWELPGGGWDAGEDLEVCMLREVREELGVEATKVGQIAFMYRAKRAPGWRVLRFIAPVEIVSHDFVLGEELVAWSYVDHKELLDLRMQDDEAGIKDCISNIWPKAE